MRDHPVVENLCRTGYPDGKEPEEIRCPVCGSATAENFYFKRDGMVAGCDDCLIPKPYWEIES